MELIDIVHQIVQESIAAGQLTDIKVGTVTNNAPLEIQISPQMAPLRKEVLYLTSAVVEKKLSTLTHSHTVGGSATSQALADAVCTENGTQLPTSDGITLNRGLEIGDKVILLRVQNGQKFIVLSRIF